MSEQIVPQSTTIYLLKSSSGKSYLGATVNLTHRLYSHFNSAKRGSHRSAAFQKEFDIVGKDGFSKQVLAIVPSELGRTYEDIFIKLYKPELNGVMMAVPFQSASHIEKVNAAKKASPFLEEWFAAAHLASSKVVRRKVLCVETGKVFDSIRDAGIFAGGTRLGVALKKPNCTAYGYHWRYADENYRPRSGLAFGRNKTKIMVVETGEVFDNHHSLKTWYLSKGVKISSAGISSGCTKNHRVGGYFLRRIDI